jgi:hypothetical protein
MSVPVLAGRDNMVIIAASLDHALGRTGEKGGRAKKAGQSGKRERLKESEKEKEKDSTSETQVGEGRHLPPPPPVENCL